MTPQALTSCSRNCPWRAATRLAVGAAAVLALAAGAAYGAERPLRQVIDEEVRAAWARQKVTPSPRAGDAAFLRRIHLDLVGTIPTHDETRAFLADQDPQKRARVIDRLLADPRFAAHQANVWDLVLFGRNPAGGDDTRRRPAFQKWLAGKFAQNEPFDAWVRALLRGEEDGSQLYHVQYRNQPEEAAVGVSRVFLGTQLQCARCHDHPYEDWTQRDFYGLAGFFVRLVVLEEGTGAGRRFRVAEKSTGEVLFTGAAKDQKPGQKGEPVKPKFLGGQELAEPPVPGDFKEPDLRKVKEAPRPLFSRKEKLAEWVTAPDNPYFARALANRLWAQFLGRGLVHPVDDLSDKNEPSHPRILEALTEHLRAHRFDGRDFIREVVNSDTYQLAATGPGAEALPAWFERARVRPLSAEVLLASLRTATGFDAAGGKLGGDTGEYVLRFFGEPTNGQGEFQGSLSEHLFLDNSGNLRQMLQPKKGNLADALLAGTASPEERVERLFLSVLCRPPAEKERARFVRHLAGDARASPALVEEAIWALVCSSEFRFDQ